MIGDSARAALAAELKVAPRHRWHAVADVAGVPASVVHGWICRRFVCVAPWILREVALIVGRLDLLPERYRPAETPVKPGCAQGTLFAVVIEAAPRRQRERIARGFGWTVGQLRRRVASGWVPEPMARAQVAAALGRNPDELEWRAA